MSAGVSMAASNTCDALVKSPSQHAPTNTTIQNDSSIYHDNHGRTRMLATDVTIPKLIAAVSTMATALMRFY